MVQAVLLSAAAGWAAARPPGRPVGAHGGGSESIRYSPHQIHLGNVRQLERGGLSTPRGRRAAGQPIARRRRLHDPTKHHVVALTPPPTLLSGGSPPSSADGANRGVTYWARRRPPRVPGSIILYASLRARGAVPGSAGRAHRPGGPRPPAAGRSIRLTTPATKGHLIGGARSEGCRAPGDVRAYDVRTGRGVFHPSASRRAGYETGPLGWSNARRHNWAGMALDEGRLVSADGSSEATIWRHRLAPTCTLTQQPRGHDRDEDLALPAGATTSGPRFPFLPPGHGHARGQPIEPSPDEKAGLRYLFDRATGAPLFPRELRPPRDGGRGHAATQPLPAARPLRSPAAHGGFTPHPREEKVLEASAEARRAVRAVGWEIHHRLRLDGGAAWGGSALDPNRSPLVNANELA